MEWMNDKESRRQYRTLALLGISKWIFLGLIVVIGILVAALTPDEDPLDRLAIKNRELVREVYVTDSIGNGFRLNYVTEKSVTKARYEEICSRPATRDSINKMAELAPQRFGDMLYTDIYDFADFAKCFDPADVQIHNIFVFGRQKKGLYFGENPRIKNWAKHYDPETEQGILYIKDEDIYCNDSLRRKKYRYYKCYGMHQFADTDEHFSHFSEDERL
jgi:hypothetical protein